MSRIVPKLDLNRTPQLADNYGLVCAKNIRVLKDGTIGPDTGVVAIDVPTLKNYASNYVDSKISILSQEIDTIDEQIEALEEQLAETPQGSDVIKDFLRNNSFAEFEGGGTGSFTLDDMLNLNSNYYCRFGSTVGEGLSKENPLIVDTPYVNSEATFLSYIKSRHGNKYSATALLFPTLSLLANVIKNKANTDGGGIVSEVIQNIEKFGETRLNYYIKVTTENFNNNYLMKNDSVTDDSDVITSYKGTYIIDKFALAYAAAFFYYWVDDTTGLSDAIDDAIAADEANYFIISQIEFLQAERAIKTKAYSEYIALNTKLNSFVTTSGNFNIRGIIPYNTCFYLLLTDTNNKSIILKVPDSVDNYAEIVNCNWNWGGGTISGVCTVNLRGETLLTIAEKSNPSLISIKTINTAISSINDLESIYTQTPEVPITQLDFAGYYPAKVSPGVYQLFIRYKISENTYTSWFPVSKPIYTARKITLDTSQGTLNYVDLKSDSDKGFILAVNKVWDTTALNNAYEKFQVGFIHSSVDGVVARSWKHFNVDTSTIYFDRAEEYIEEIDIKDLTSSLYGIYNVGNITSFRNKLYISNYVETDFNPVDLVTFTKTVKVNIAYIVTGTQSGTKDSRVLTNETLIPYQTYAFYIHYVKANGEFTNGYKIGEDVYIDDTIGYTDGQGHEHRIYNDCNAWTRGSSHVTEPMTTTCDKLIYPTFTLNQGLPDGYVAYFVSMKRVKGKTMQLFNIKTPFSTRNGTPYRAFADCLELDTLLEGIIDDIPITCKDDDGNWNHNTKGKYHPSYDISDIYCFGASGKVVFTYQGLGQDDLIEGCINQFITLDYDAGNNNLTLQRCTPIMRPDGYAYADVYNYVNQLSLGGYLCEVTKPDVLSSSDGVITEFDTYISGNNWYHKTGMGAFGPTADLNLRKFATEFSDVDRIATSIVNRIYSNYNLEYMSITQTLSPKIVTGREDMLVCTDSMTLNAIYELNKMFFDFTKKLYLTYSASNNQTTFDNTIRSSKTIGDEDSINIYKFLSDDYYNVPVDKGIIVNLKAVGNVILVHTQDSLYKFSGNNSLSSSGGEEVQLAETDVFDTGITELFGSEFGFGGLKDKSHAMASEHSYVFFDAYSGNMYMVKGQGELKIISGNIKKFIDAKSIINVVFASDYYNDRFFVKLVNSNTVLSYNYNTNSFVSVHDFTFTSAFNTKTRCYFVYNNCIYQKQLKYSASHTNNDLKSQTTVFPIFFKNINNVNVPRPYVDIIINENYDAIKTLNYINYIINRITAFSGSVYPVNDGVETVQQMNTLNTAQENLAKYMIYAIQIYTNMAATKIILASYNDNPSQVPENERYLYSTLYPKDKPYYEKGRWNFNYFRNALDTNSQTNSDNVSLIYGNYFVVRLIFDPYVDFKLENLNINYGKEYETSFR